MAKLMLAYRHWPISIADYFRRAFIRAGHTVYTVGPYSGDDGLITWPGKPRLDTNAHRPDFIVSEAWQQYPFDDKFIRLTDADNFDAIISFDAGFRLSPQPSLPVKQAIYLTDPHAKPYDGTSAYEYVFSSQPAAYRPELRIDEWIPLGYDPFIHRRFNDPRAIDVAFVGVSEGPGYVSRLAGIQALQQAGIECYTGIHPPQESNSLYNTAKIAYNWSSSWDIPMRIFEGMAAGCCVVTNRLPYLSALGFVEGRDYLGYDSINELVTVTKHALSTGLWERVAADGNMAVAPWTYDKAAADLLYHMGIPD